MWKMSIRFGFLAVATTRCGSLRWKVKLASAARWVRWSRSSTSRLCWSSNSISTQSTVDPFNSLLFSLIAKQTAKSSARASAWGQTFLDLLDISRLSLLNKIHGIHFYFNPSEVRVESDHSKMKWNEREMTWDLTSLWSHERCSWSE